MKMNERTKENCMDYEVESVTPRDGPKNIWCCRLTDM